MSLSLLIVRSGANTSLRITQYARDTNCTATERAALFVRSMMKILYGVQGTGNGHLTRAHCMVQAFAAYPVQLDFVISSRDPSKPTGLEAYGHCQYFEGLTFHSKSGHVDLRYSFQQAKFLQFFRDVLRLDVSSYDLVLTDFEPISAWAAGRQGIPSLGLSHQCAFSYPIPMEGDNWITRLILRKYVFTTYKLGTHWDSFGFPILPPIVDTAELRPLPIEDFYLVYLPFESPEEIVRTLHAIPEARFRCYGHWPHREETQNIVLHPVSKTAFHRDLRACRGVISNAGFELASEALHLGKPILVKPLYGQMEQLSNAKALVSLGLGQRMENLSTESIRTWLDRPTATRIVYPNVAAELARWITSGADFSKTTEISEKLWGAVQRTNTFKEEPRYTAITEERVEAE